MNSSTARPRGTVPARETRELHADECVELLATARWGVLATSGDGQPYAVPVAFAYDGDAVIIAMSEGEKARNIDRVSAVCFTVVDIADIRGHWRSVVLRGEGEWVTDLPARLRSFDALRRQHGVRFDSAPRDVARLARARLLRIPARHVTGRAAGHQPQADDAC